VRNGVGFAIWAPEVWSSDPSAVRVALANKQLWVDGSTAVLEHGSEVFQTFKVTGKKKELKGQDEGKQRMQRVLGGPKPAPQILHTISRVYDNLDRQITDKFRVRETTVLAGQRPKGGFVPAAQLHHSDNRVPDIHNVLLIGAGAERVGLWIWEHSAGIVIRYVGAGGTQEAYNKLVGEVESKCPVPTFVVLEPGEMIVMHGNVIHAGASLDGSCEHGSMRVHMYMQSRDPAARTEHGEDYTILLRDLQAKGPGTPGIEEVFGRGFCRRAG
jgi:hypothetical protein